MVAKGFGITLTTHSTVGAIYPGVSFLPISDAAQVVSSSVVWSETNQNPAMKRLLELASSHASRRKQASSRRCSALNGERFRGRQADPDVAALGKLRRLFATARSAVLKREDGGG